MILVTGSTGNTGAQVASELRRRNVPFKVMVRSDKNRAIVEKLGYEAVHGDFDRPESLDAALAGKFEKAYLVCTPGAGMADREIHFIDAARRAGVSHVVKLSAFLSTLDAPTANLRDHGRVEKHLIDSGMDFTILRPHGFMQTFVLFTLDFIRGAGAYMHPAGDGAMPLVDVRDLGVAGANALLDPAHKNTAYDITGPESLTYKEQARILGEAFHRPVTYIPGDEKQFMRVMDLLGVEAQSAEHARVIMRMCREGKMADMADGLQRLGVNPTTFKTFAEDLSAGRTGGGNSYEPPSGIVFGVMKRLMIWSLRARFAVRGRGD